uniref:F-box domain-containing protein n=1 Tax=Anopheles farauti TaxID=69004 RepID=A0A182QU85_9DIPT
MEEIQQLQQQQRPSFPPGGTKWHQDAGASSHEGGSFGQDSGYTSYQATTPNNTLNQSSRHGASGSLATIDECNELDCSMNDSSTGLLGAIDLTPRTAASVVLLSNIHLTTPKSASDRSQRFHTRRPNVFDYDGSIGSSANTSSFQAPSTPERLPRMVRQESCEAQETPLRTGNRSASHSASQLTPHKAKGSLKRKHSAFREKLYADGGTDDVMSAGDTTGRDENDPRDLNDSFDADCRRLEDISPIPNVKRRKHLDRGIADLIRSSTPKTVSSKPTFLRAESNENVDRPTARRTLRKFQSFSPSKILPSARTARGAFGRHTAFRAGALAGLEGEKTPEKQKVQRVLTEILPDAAIIVPPIGLAGLLEAPILEEPSTTQLEQTVTIVPSFEDFSLTPSKTSLIDPELPIDDCVARHAPNFSYAPTLNSILEESPVKAQFIPGKLPLPKTPPSVTKSARKLKRLGTNESSAASSFTASPARSIRSLSGASLLSRASVSPKARRPNVAPKQSFHTHKPYSYCGFKYLNILHQLSKRNPHALETLLDYIDDPSLVQVVRVSRGWRAIIQNHPKSWRRLQCHLQERELHKENTNTSIAHRGKHGCTASSTSCMPVPEKETDLNGPVTGGNAMAAAVVAGTVSGELPAVVTVVDSNVPKRQPFKLRNSFDTSHTSGVSNASFAHGPFVSNISGPDLSHRRSSVSSTVGSAPSPPVSPSMRQFVNNQKVVSRLKPSEQLRPCPRCRQPSRIIYSRTSTQKKSSTSARASAVGARLAKSYSLPDPDAQCSHAPDPMSHRNNNDYPEHQQPSNDSPNRVRKNLFNSSISSDRTPGNRSKCLQQRMKLRSSAASKSFDCAASIQPSAAVDDQLGVRDSKCDYAICSGQSCGFRFCIKCLCDYHPNTVCADLSVNSPTKEEERDRSYMACTRENRRSLLRLCRKF